MVHYISNEVLLLEQLDTIINTDVKLKLSEEAVLNIEKCHTFFTEKVKDTSLSEATEQHYTQLRHYACGIGERLPCKLVRIMLFLKVQSFSYGFSGEGEVCIQNKIYSAQELASKYGWEPLPLSQREVDALLNGTQLTTAYSAHNLIESLKLIEWADFVASVSTQVFGGNLSAFSELMQVVRPHKGLVETAQHLRTLLKDSTLVDSPEDFQSMPEAFCSIPQIHGAVREAIAAIRKVVKTEINSVTDNPILFPEQGEIIFGGNSHTLPLSLSMDFLSITLTSLGNISERRVFYLLSNVGKDIETEIDYPIFQRIIEGILNENRRLSTPSSIESPILFEKTIDIKGMGGSSAIKCSQIVKNVMQIIAIELILATSLWKKKPLRYHSSIFKDYLDFIAEEGSSTTLKKQIEHTILFFNSTQN